MTTHRDLLRDFAIDIVTYVDDHINKLDSAPVKGVLDKQGFMDFAEDKIEGLLEELTLWFKNGVGS